MTDALSSALAAARRPWPSVWTAAASVVAALLALFTVTAAFAAVVLPYARWDALYFGAWSRLIADGSFRGDGVGPEQLHRPLFYVLQGILWMPFGVHEAAGRVLSLAFSVLLAVSLYLLARRIWPSRLEALVCALCVVLVPAFAIDVVGGITDVPVAALVAATGAVLWRGAATRPRAVALVVLAAAAALTKPSALFGLAGLVLAACLGSRAGLRARVVRGALPICGGVAVALVYGAIEAHAGGDSLRSFLSAGTGDYYARLADSVRADVLLAGTWLGPDLRLPVAFGLVYALLALARLGPRLAAGGAAVAAAAATWLLPSLADGGPRLGAGPFAGGLDLHDAVYLLELLLLPLTVLARGSDAPSRLWLGRLLVWAAPGFAAWAVVSVYADRLLSTAWPPLLLLSAIPILLALRGARRVAPAVAPAVVAPLVLAGVLALPNVDGLGEARWQTLRDGGPSAWTDGAQMRSLALGSFDDELTAVRAHLGPGERLVSSDGKLRFFFVHRLEYGVPSSCAELEGSRVFVLLTDPDSVAQNGDRGVDDWLSCSRPRTHLVAEMPSSYAVFVVGAPPRVPPAPSDCRVPEPGGGIVAVLGGGLSRGEAEQLRARAVEVGYRNATVERRGCETYDVVVAGYTSMSQEAGVRREAESVGLDVHFEDRRP